MIRDALIVYLIAAQALHDQMRLFLDNINKLAAENGLPSGRRFHRHSL